MLKIVFDDSAIEYLMGERMRGSFFLGLILVVNLGVQSHAQEIEEEFGQGLEFSAPNLYESIPKFAKSDIPKSRPNAFTLSPLPKAGNQGAQGSCSGWAVSYGAKSINYAKKNSLSASQMVLFSPSYVYNLAQEGNCKSGVTMTSALSVVLDKGALPLSEFPYSPNECAVPSDDQMSAGQKFAIGDFERVTEPGSLSDNDFEDILRLISGGFPVIAGIAVPPSFKSFRKKASTEVLSASDTNGKYKGHAIVLVGFDDSRNAVLILNSWGQNWGTGGLAWLDYNYLKGILREAYVVLDK